MRLTVDKIASVTRNLGLTKTLTLTEAIETRAGAVVVGQVLNDKTTYNQLEDVNGRMSTVQKGDLIVGALGHRNALQGYEGVLPERVGRGDILNLLNLGGVIGRSISHNPDVGPPFDVEVLGQVLVFPEFRSRVGQPANIDMAAVTATAQASNCPVIMIAGTCMNSGKTAAACAIIRHLAHAGLRVGGTKLTGVSLVRDILGMRDYGAEWVLDFTDAGVVCSNAEVAAASARTLFAALESKGAEVIVAETGDGIMGEYGVQAVLGDPDLKRQSTVYVLCANDPVGVSGGIRHMKEAYGIEVDVVAGPATDNRVGTRFVESTFGIPALNARTSGPQLGQLVLDLVRQRGGKPCAS